MNKLKNPLVIVANGEFPTHLIPLSKLQESASILACDGAANTLIDQGIIPDIIIEQGQFESNEFRRLSEADLKNSLDKEELEEKNGDQLNPQKERLDN